MDSRKPITIYDIAKEAGVSVSTVSRVLTNNARVSKAKKEKVEQLIKKYDYMPNALARGLSETRSNVIGIISPDVRNPFYATLFVECEKAANEYGYRVLLCNSLSRNEIEDLHLENLVGQRVDAVIQSGGRVDELISDSKYVDKVNRVANKIPVIITGKLDGADCYQVNIDEGKAMEVMLEYLISEGHRKIALIGGRKDVKGTVDKRFRYKQVLSRYGIEYKEEYDIEGLMYDDTAGYEGMNQLFKLPKLPSVVMAINDYTAVGIIRAITEKGLSIPNDISVVSFDNTYLSDLTIPRLTGVGYDYEEFGRKIIEVAIGAIKGDDVPRISLVDTKLVVKESCKSMKE
ncbi:MAG TPA: LacI family DNA-binding transcriptional regulator [Lachnospiraceae bacterium]|nr:LacI family DNA-binding transcriptional regulator [Lachnospiraceae bacterium]